MTAARRSNLVTAAIFFAALLLFSLLFARLAGAGIDAGDLTVADAGVDRVVLADHAEPLDAGPYRTPAVVVDRVVAADYADPGAVRPPPPNVEPSTVAEGADLASWIWSRFRNGQAGAAAIVLLQALGLLAIKRWSWVSLRLPLLVRGKALAAVSSLTGGLGTLAPLAIAGAPIATPLVGVVLAAVGVYLLPAPAQIAGQTVPSSEAVPT